MNSNTFGLTEKELKGIVKVLSANRKVDSAVLFGSRAKGNHTNGSDIDIAVSGRELSLNDLLDLMAATDDLDLPYKIDLLVYEKIRNPDLLDHISRVGRKLF